MGLDVYLYKFNDWETSKKVNKEYEIREKEIWGLYDRLTEEQKNKAREQIKRLEETLNLKEYEGERFEVNSLLYPLHLFKLGYFRSSYNGSGFNHVVGDAIGMDLYSIFDPKDQYEFIPNWEEAKKKTELAIAQFKEYMQNGAYRVATIPGYHNQANDSQDALNIFTKEMEQQKHSPFLGNEFLNIRGEFMPKGFKINGVINGKQEIYLIYEDEHISWYLEALEIVLETINHVLGQEDKEKYVLHWSS